MSERRTTVQVLAAVLAVVAFLAVVVLGGLWIRSQTVDDEREEPIGATLEARVVPSASDAVLPLERDRAPVLQRQVRDRHRRVADSADMNISLVCQVEEVVDEWIAANEDRWSGWIGQ